VPEKPAEEEGSGLLAGALKVGRERTNKESCGAHSSLLSTQEIATRATR